MPRLLDHLYIFATLVLGVYSQLVIRWQVGLAGGLPENLEGKLFFIAKLLISPWVLSALTATFLSGVAWMMTMTKFEISYAYPWISLNFVIVLICGVLLFGENFSTAKAIGTLLIMAGIVVLARG